MDISNILQSLKGKVLDAAHFDLLKHAYELQEENIKQLKTNNEALKESNLLITEELNRLREEREGLSGELSHVKSLIPRDSVKLSEYSQHVLDLYSSNDAVEMFESKLLEGSKLTKIQTQHAITELQEYGILSYAIPKAGGNLFLLQPRGKELLANQQKSL